MGRQAGGGSPPEGNRLPFIPAQKGPSEPPAPPPARAAGAVARRGVLWRRQGLLVTGSLPGSPGTGRGRWGAELHPPGPSLAQEHSRLGFCPCHGPCQHQQHPQPCPGVDPNLCDTQTLLCATLGAWHNMEGQPSTLPGSGTGGWSISPVMDGKAGFSPSTFLAPSQCCQLWAGDAEGAAG